MAGGVHGLQRPAGAFDDRAVLEPVVRHEVAVRAFLDHRPLPAPVRAEAVARRAGCGLDVARRRRVVDVGVGHDEVGHGLAPHGREHGIDVLGQVRPGVDDRHLAAAHDVGAGAVEGEDARVVRDDPADQRRDLRHRAIGEFELTDVGERLAHWRGLAMVWISVARMLPPQVAAPG